MRRLYLKIAGGFVLMLLFAVVMMSVVPTFALTYQSGVGMKFTFNPTLTVSLSDTDLEIAELTAGTYADSNVITVSVNTNVSHGYTLSATAGSSSYSGSSNFNANDLVLTNGSTVDTTQTNFFSALSTSASLSSMSLADTDTWGYTYSSDSGTTWANYSGLPLYTAESGAELISTDDAADSSSVQFKIAAKASNDKSSGEYTNVVNFVAVANPVPVYCNPEGTSISTIACMQDFIGGNLDSIVASMNTDTQYTLMDSRDGKTYTVAKLRDGNVWMTQNLDLDLDNTRVYTNEDTDIGWNSSTGSYDEEEWTPDYSTYQTGDYSWNVDSIDNADYAPLSYDPGNLYWNGVVDEEQYYSSLDTTTTAWDAYRTEHCSYAEYMSCDRDYLPTSQFTSSTGIPQYHLGNYYNWTAAIAENDSSDYYSEYEGYTVNRSICPAGWTLPNWYYGETYFESLWQIYNFGETTHELDPSTHEPVVGGRNIWDAPLYTFPGGSYQPSGYVSEYGIGWQGFYYTSYLTSDQGVETRTVGVSDLDVVYDVTNDSEWYSSLPGNSIRCVARPQSDDEFGGGE